MSLPSEICFVGLKCYDLLSKKPIPQYLGGIEKQLVSLGRELVRRGHKVSFITYAHDEVGDERIDGIAIFKAYSLKSGIRWLRFIYPRMIKLWLAMRRANARIYVQMGAGNETGEVAIGSKLILRRRQFIFCVASDMDGEMSLSQLKSRVERFLYRIGLRFADLVIAQTAHQKTLFNSNFKKKTSIIRMPIETRLSQGKVDRKARFKQRNIIWVGRIVPVKRLEMLIEIAADCKGLNFHIVGSPNVEDAYFKDLIEKCARHENILMHGRVDDEKLHQLYAGAALLCCTSSIEGFPTTFIESWSYGLPIVTTFDPDGIIKDNGIGFVAQNKAQVKEQLMFLVGNESAYTEISVRAEDYFRNHFSINAILPKYHEIISNLT